MSKFRDYLDKHSEIAYAALLRGFHSILPCPARQGQFSHTFMRQQNLGKKIPALCHQTDRF